MGNFPTIRFKKLDPQARTPEFGRYGDAGSDLFSVHNVRVSAGLISKVHTGIAVEIPYGYVGLLWDRSGLGINDGIKRLAGVIDCNYRGEIVVGVTRLVSASNGPHQIRKGDRVVQLLIQPVEMGFTWVEADRLSETTRGVAGFGSSDKLEQGYKQHCEREAQGLPQNATIMPEQLQQTGQGWAEPPDDQSQIDTVTDRDDNFVDKHGKYKDHNYDRLCNMKGCRNRIHKNNSVGLCPSCYSSIKKEFQDAQGGERKHTEGNQQ